MLGSSEKIEVKQQQQTRLLASLFSLDWVACQALSLAENVPCSEEAGGIGQEGGSVESLRQELLESRVRLEEREVAALLRASPAEILRVRAR